ncbi:MAG TPA: putative glycolipid-binding domain-containing protein [Actinomycetota bacterium]|jgi:hypothetical protein
MAPGAGGSRLVRAVLWRALIFPGTEYCALWEGEGGWSLQGTAVLSADEAPSEIRYRVSCDKAWRTLDVEVVHSADDEERVDLRAGDDGHWFRADEELVEVTGCIDVDLGFSPSTNTLPIRRLGLAVGDSAEVRAAWVRFPQLTVEPLHQRYTRLGSDRYLYESLASDFRAELEVDDLGLIVRYPGGWERAAAAGPLSAVAKPTG